MRKTSILWNKTLIEEAILASNSISECLNFLGLRAAGGNYQAFYKACNFHNLNYPIYSPTNKTLRANLARTISLDQILIENSNYSNRKNIKKKCYANGSLKEECYICGLGTFWNGKPISLQLDHINGIHNDHRIENLRILCPNCHSQTDTFAGRKGLPKSSKIDRRTLRNDRPEKRKFEVDKKELSELISIYSWVELGRKFNVSDNAVRKRAKKLGLI